jgi:hypothetical protein
MMIFAYYALQLSDDSTSSMNVVVNSNSLKLNWKDNSGCSPQMTYLNLQIFQVIIGFKLYLLRCCYGQLWLISKEFFFVILKDGIADNGKSNNTLRIPRSCLKQDTIEENVFSIVLPVTNPQTCPIEWKPLDRCRKYSLDMSSQYTKTWNGHMISANIFTRGSEGLLEFFI